MLENAIEDVIRERIFKKKILVWYDPSGTLINIISKMVMVGIRCIPYEGSYLKIRTTLEENDPRLEKNWLIYIPEEELDPSWIQDYEQFGSKIVMDLEGLATQKLGVASNTKIRVLLRGLRGKELATNWNEVMQEEKGIGEQELMMGLLKIAFNGKYDFSLTDAILEYLAFPQTYVEKLERLDLQGIFSELISTKLGLKLESSPIVSPTELAASIFFSELSVLSDFKLAEKEFNKLLPNKERRSEWVKILRDWQQNTRLQKSFIDWSRKVEQKYEVKEKIVGFAELVHISSFQCIDDILLEELFVRLNNVEHGIEDERQREMLLKISEIRSNIIWSLHNKGSTWKVIKISIDLYNSCVQAIETLDQTTTLKAEDYIERFYCDSGWWNIDRLYLDLAVIVQATSDRLFKFFFKPSSELYIIWLRNINSQFSQAMTKTRVWKARNTFNPQSFWNLMVDESTIPTAVFFVDALRFDLCKSLETSLLQNGYQIKVHNMLSCLPSITEIGMAILLPGTTDPIKITVRNRNLNVILNDQVINGKGDRERWLRSIIGDKLLITDFEVIRTNNIEDLHNLFRNRKLIVAMDREIDKAGTFLPEVSPELFYKHLTIISQLVSKVHDAGIQRIIITTDHGFIIMPNNTAFQPIKIESLPEDVCKSRRYLIGKPPTIENFISMPIKSLGLSGDGNALFPVGIRTISIGGEYGSFVHGGISLQENCIATIVSISTTKPKKVGISVSTPPLITTAIFIVHIFPVKNPDANIPRRVYVEVSNDEIILSSPSYTIKDENIKINMKLTKIVDEVEVRVIDLDSKEMVFSKKVKVELEGYDDIL